MSVWPLASRYTNRAADHAVPMAAAASSANPADRNSHVSRLMRAGLAIVSTRNSAIHAGCSMRIRLGACLPRISGIVLSDLRAS